MFGELMHDRLSQGLDDKKIELAQGTMDFQEEDTEEDDTEEDDENAEVSGVSGDD
jgi:hypothetical protein